MIWTATLCFWLGTYVTLKTKVIGNESFLLNIVYSITQTLSPTQDDIFQNDNFSIQS